MSKQEGAREEGGGREEEKWMSNLSGSVNPLELNFRPVGVAETGVVGDGADAVLLEGRGHFVALVPRQAVDDSAFATEPLVDHLRHLRQHVGLHLLRQDAVLQIRPVERRQEPSVRNFHSILFNIHIGRRQQHPSRAQSSYFN